MSVNKSQAMANIQARAECLRIPRKLDTCSTANWTAVSEQTGHPFQTKLDSLDAPAALSH